MGLFAYTTPVSEYKLVGVKYIIKISMFLIAFLMAIGNAAVIGHFSDKPVTLEVVQNLLLIGAAIGIFSFIQTPMLINCKAEGAVTKVKTLFNLGVVACLFIAQLKIVDTLVKIKEKNLILTNLS